MSRTVFRGFLTIDTHISGALKDSLRREEHVNQQDAKGGSTIPSGNVTISLKRPPSQAVCNALIELLRVYDNAVDDSRA